MEHSVTRFSFIQGVTAANFLHHLAYIDPFEHLVRWKVDYAENRASAWWLDAQLTPFRRCIFVTSVLRRRALGYPENRID